ncbi:MAG: response regulator [Kiritimatiellae bacterium]|nr:response regulator [Kiritimatiellia bacterium]
MQRFLKAELEKAYNIHTARDGEQGFKLALEHEPDLILTDMMLPKMDGITLCRKLKSNPELLPSKIILLTARADDQTKISALQAGVDDFLTKPFSTIELKTRLGNLLVNARLEKELKTQNMELENTLEQLRHTETQLIQSERLSGLGSLSAGIMHEINNPINFMVTATHYLKGSLQNSSEEIVDTVIDIEDGLKRVRDIIADLKSFAYGNPTEKQSECDPEQIWRTTKRLLSHEINKVTLEEQIDAETSIMRNENQLVQLMTNLLQNAIQATQQSDSKEERRIQIHMYPQNGHYLTSIRDNGTGIEKDVQPKIFNPFFTTKQVGQGMGRGLSISHTIVKSHNGEISVESEPGKFTEFKIKIPLKEREKETANQQPGTFQPKDVLKEQKSTFHVHSE